MQIDHLSTKRVTLFQSQDALSLAGSSTDVATWISPPVPIKIKGVRLTAGFPVTGADTNTTKISLAEIRNPLTTKVYAEIELASGTDITYQTILNLTILDADVPANTVLGFAHIIQGTGLAGQTLYRGAMEIFYT